MTDSDTAMQGKCPKCAAASNIIVVPLRARDEVSKTTIVRHRRDHIHYEALEQKSFIGAIKLRNVIRYNITSSGRTILATHA